jgi:two-component system chemotaxis response regulator CheY
MIVDEAVSMRKILRRFFESAGCEVVAEAADGEEAVRLYKVHRPNLLTMDLALPVLDGFQAMQQIRRFDPQAKIVICSSMSQQKIVIQAIHSGAKDFVVKPILPERLAELVEKLLCPAHEKR